MNNKRRSMIADLIMKLEQIRETVASASALAESIRDEEQEYFDAMPENLQNGEKGEKANSAIEHMDTVVGLLEDVEANLGDAATELDEAAQ